MTTHEDAPDVHFPHETQVEKVRYIQANADGRYSVILLCRSVSAVLTVKSDNVPAQIRPYENARISLTSGVVKRHPQYGWQLVNARWKPVDKVILTAEDDLARRDRLLSELSCRGLAKYIMKETGTSYGVKCRLEELYGMGLYEDIIGRRFKATTSIRDSRSRDGVSLVHRWASTALPELFMGKTAMSRSQFQLLCAMTALNLPHHRPGPAAGMSDDDDERSLRIPSTDARTAVENPYMLCLAYRMSWKKVQVLADAFVTDPSSPELRRLHDLCVIVDILRRNQESGHTFMERSELEARYRAENGRVLDLSCVDATGSHVIRITAAPGMRVARIALEETARMEEDIAECIAEKMDLPGGEFDEDVARMAFRTVTGFVPDGTQLCAMRMAMENMISIISGGPGKGKSVTTAAIIRMLRGMKGVCVHACAPTGKAAQRITEISGLTATTIHLLLRCPRWVRPPGTCDLMAPCDGCPCMSGSGYQFAFRSDARHVVIVDEASMLNLRLSHRLFMSFPAGTKFLIIGDPDQLPCIGYGDVLGDVLSVPSVPRTFLMTTHRQAFASWGILAVADDIREETFAVPVTEERPGVHFQSVAVFGNQSVEKSVVLLIESAFVSEFRDRADWVQMLVHFQVIIPTYKGDAGIHAVNRVLQKRNPNVREVPEGPCIYFDTEVAAQHPGAGPKEKLRLHVGDKIILKKNDHERKVFNGSLGMVAAVNHSPRAKWTTCDETGPFVAIRYFGPGKAGDVTCEYAIDDGYLKNHIGLAYAVSAHKSQGSEFESVALASCRAYPRVLQTKKLVYTGVTRAKKTLRLIYEPEALNEAVRRADVPRKTTLAENITCGLQRNGSH